MHYVMGALPHGRRGWAGSLVVLMRMGGILLGASLATLVYEGRRGVSRAAGLGDDPAAALAFSGAFWIATGIGAAATLLSLLPPRAGGALHRSMA